MITLQPWRWGRRIGRGIGVTLAGVVAGAGLYCLAAAICAVMPVNHAFVPADGGVDVYLRSNGVHVDLVLPLDAAGIDWRTRLPRRALGLGPDDMPSLAFGWGDRGVYLTAPTWAELTVSTALWAATGADAAVMHVEATTTPRGSLTRRIVLSQAQYRHLAHYIESGFRRDATGAVIVVPGAHYGWHDAFFEATGHYSALRTCNEWTRQGLTIAGVRVPLWSPFAAALLYQVPDRT